MTYERNSKQRTKKQREASMRNWQLRAIHATAHMMFSLLSRGERQEQFVKLINEEIQERKGKTVFMKGFYDAISNSHR